MSSIESKGQIPQAFQHDARIAAEKHSDKFAGNSLGHAYNSGIAATSFEKGAKWAFEFLRALSSPKAYPDYTGQYESWAHEIMAESGIDDTLRDNMIPGKLDSVRSFVRVIVDSMINTSEGWRELYEREKAHSSQSRLQWVKAVERLPNETIDDLFIRFSSGTKEVSRFYDGSFHLYIERTDRWGAIVTDISEVEWLEEDK